MFWNNLLDSFFFQKRKIIYKGLIDGAATCTLFQTRRVVVEPPSIRDKFCFSNVFSYIGPKPQSKEEREE